jgi:hypothetical protein
VEQVPGLPGPAEERKSTQLTAKELLAAAATAAVMVPLMPGTSHAAAPTVIVEKAQYLAKNPVVGMPSAKVERRLYLAGGNYSWQTHVGRFNTGGKHITLRPGWYTMTVWMHPKRGKYTQDAYLNPDAPGLSNAFIRGCVTLKSSAKWLWGSILDPKF